MTTDRRQKYRSQVSNEGRILARSMSPSGGITFGLQPLGISSERDGFLYIPISYQPDHPAPLVVMLHGAGGNANHGLAPFIHLADAAGLILLAPDSRRQTWDVLFGQYGSDIDFIDQALTQTFSRYAIDLAQIAVAGFSDGASYALSIALMNGDLFTHAIAFSPGFIAPITLYGWPRLFLAHGTHDEVLPIDVCSRKILRQLQGTDYDVCYREFEGGHTIPPEIVREALTWFMVEAK